MLAWRKWYTHWSQNPGSQICGFESHRQYFGALAQLKINITFRIGGIFIKAKLVNEYKNMGDYYIGYSPKTKEEFYFDAKYYDIIKNHRWELRSDKYPVTKINNHNISMQKLLFGDNIFIHVNKNNADVREENIKNIKGYKNGGKTYLNGYIAIYMPEHKRAFDNGCVYEHILEAEKMLKRDLKPLECVHHKNRDRTDNRHENLMVFATNEDHIAFHDGGEAILTEDGSYVTKRKYDPYYMYINRTAEDIKNGKEDKGSVYVFWKDLCPICKKNIKTVEAKMCIECRNKERAKNIPPKEELEKLIYTTSFLKIAKMYNVSDNAVRRWCDKYNLPRRRMDIINNKK